MVVPRQNPPRSIRAEDTLAERVMYERMKREWSYETLAARMTDLGCHIHPSALFKIEKGRPRRRITVDELIGLGLAFGVPTEDLLMSARAQKDVRFRELLDETRRYWVGLREAEARYEAQANELSLLCADSEGGDERYEAIRDELARTEQEVSEMEAVVADHEAAPEAAELQALKVRLEFLEDLMQPVSFERSRRG